MREWKIRKSCYAGGKYFYQIYRIVNEAEPDHSGNREVISTADNLVEAAENLLAIVNGEERKKKTLKSINADTKNNYGVEAIVEEIIDIVEVVRCKYCENYQLDHPLFKKDKNNSRFFCKRMYRYMEIDGYCNYGAKGDNYEFDTEY